MLLFQCLSSLSFCKPLGTSQERSGGDNSFFYCVKTLTNETRRLKNNLLPCNSLNLVHLITKTNLVCKERTKFPRYWFLEFWSPICCMAKTVFTMFLLVRITKLTQDSQNSFWALGLASIQTIKSHIQNFSGHKFSKMKKK